VERYGVVGGKMLRDGGVIKIDTLVEKPSRDAAPSRLAIAARYVLSPTIFECLERTQAGKGGEIQLTDAIKLLLERGEPVHGVVLSARRHDIGNPIDWLKTNLLFASRDRATWDAIKPMLRELLDGDDTRSDNSRA
jgi:UTP--glucose-1-phosphate uridylyltransferase